MTDGRKLAERPKLWHRNKRPTNGQVGLAFQSLMANKASRHSDSCVLLPYLVDMLEKLRTHAYQIDRVPGQGAMLTIVPLNREDLNHAVGISGESQEGAGAEAVDRGAADSG